MVMFHKNYLKLKLPGPFIFSRKNSHFIQPTKELVCLRHAPVDYPVNSALVYGNMISFEESNALIHVVQDRVKRKRYQKGHWDQVISDYREIELQELDDNFDPSDESGINICKEVIRRIRRHLEKSFFCNDDTVEKCGEKSKPIQWLPCHAIDLRKDGVLSPHVDSVRFSGDIVAGLSLKSSSIMRLKPQDHGINQWVDLLLPPLSLYVLSGVSRFNYTHELLSSGATFQGLPINRLDRISIIFRDALRQSYPSDTKNMES